VKNVGHKIILLAVLYGSETWSVTLREEYRLVVFENRVLRRIFGPKRDEVTGGCRKLHNKELHNVYFSQSVIRTMKSRRMIWAGHVARMDENRNAYRLFLGNTEGKRPLGRSRRRCVDNIKIDVGEIGCTVWTGLVCLRIATTGRFLRMMY
jgi:hypothetical protein